MSVDDLGGGPIGGSGLAEVAELATLATGTPTATIRRAGSPETELAGHGLAHGLLPSEHVDRLCALVVAQAQPVRFPDPGGSQPPDSPVRFAAGHPLTGADGTVLGALVVVDDRPRPDPAAAQRALALLAARVVDVLVLEESRRRPAGSGADLRAYAGRLSHDLKNPLSAIRMSVELAREEAPADGDLAALLDRATRAADRLAALLDAHAAGVERD